MLPLLLHILVICTSLLAWTILTINGFFLFRHLKDPKARLLTVIMVALWLVTSFNAWYEGVFLFERIALLSTVNSWAFTLITPLFYLYYRFRITALYPDRRKWTQHLLLPGLLAGIYISLYLFSETPDKLFYSWNELFNYNYSEWTLFRAGCYLSLVIQLYVYLPRLFGIRGIGGQKSQPALRIKREMRYIVCFCLLSVVTMFAPSPLSKLLYNLAVVALGGYFFSLLPSYRRLRQRLGSYLFPLVNADTPHDPSGVSPTQPFAQSQPSTSEQFPLSEEYPYPLFTPDEEKHLIEQLNAPDLLHNPDLTIGMLARHLSTNETYLSRYFNRQLGVSFPEYVSTCRLNEAEALLIETDDSIIYISEQVGFQTLSTFYQTFNARHQVPPSQWRKNRKNS